MSLKTFAQKLLSPSSLNYCSQINGRKKKREKAFNESMMPVGRQLYSTNFIWKLKAAQNKFILIYKKMQRQQSR